jgi:hypothetical protein
LKATRNFEKYNSLERIIEIPDDIVKIIRDTKSVSGKINPFE